MNAFARPKNYSLSSKMCFYLQINNNSCCMFFLLCEQVNDLLKRNWNHLIFLSKLKLNMKNFKGFHQALNLKILTRKNTKEHCRCWCQIADVERTPKFHFFFLKRHEKSAKVKKNIPGGFQHFQQVKIIF